MTTEWGDPIEVNGERPAWLRDSDECSSQSRGRHDKGEWYRDGEGQRAGLWFWSSITHIRLPADHPYYLATSRGFTYWPGGDKAPEDWDRGSVLFRMGGKSHGLNGAWDWRMGQGGGHPKGGDIIGYKKIKIEEEQPMAYSETAADEFEAPEQPEDWAKIVAYRRVYPSAAVPDEKIFERKLVDHLIHLALMIQKYEPHLRPVDPDVLVVRGVLAAWESGRRSGGALVKSLLDGTHVTPAFDAALAAYKEAKQ